MVDIFLTILCFSGFVYASSRWLRIDFSYAPLFATSLVGILLFVFAVSNYLKPGTFFLIYTGFILSGVCTIDAWRNRRTSQFSLIVPRFTVLVSLVAVSFLAPLWMKFTVIDDYVYWGIIGKYLFMNHHLPDPNTTIIAKHLAYTPGTSVFHYFFYMLTGKYSPSISYFAQNILLITALFVVVKKESIKRTIIFLCLLIFLLTLFSGSIFTKLQVDYLLSIYFFAILWIYFTEKSTFLTILTISLPACFLFLIKEIGFVLGLFVLIIILFDLIFHKDLDRKIKVKAIIFVFFTTGILFLLKQTWAVHLQTTGFLKFNTAVNMESIKLSFHIFSDENIQKGFLIFIKGILIGPADRLNLPYIFWYLAVVFFWIKIFAKLSADNKSRYARLLKIISVSFMIYLIMMYFLQIIIFRVGAGYDHTIGLTRYMNIFFSQVVFFTALLYVDYSFFQKKVSDKMVYSFIIAVILVLGLSRIETSLHRESHYKEAELIAKKVEMNIDNTKENLICIVPGTDDKHLGIKLLYHLLPNRVNHGGFPVKNREIFLSNLLKYDYVLFNNPNDSIVEWITPFIDKTFENLGFFMIKSDGVLQTGKDKNIRLKRLF